MLLRSFAALVVVGSVSAATAAAQEPPPAGQAVAAASAAPAQQTGQDDLIKDRINRRLETSPVVRKYDVKVRVANGVVTLEGDVATAAQKAEAAKLAQMDGVTRVDNAIKVDPTEDKTVADRIKSGLSKTGEAITDAWITTKVKWFFVGEDQLDGSDINVDTKDNVVTLKGTVKTPAGRARAIELAKNTDGVKRVVDALIIKYEQ